MKPKVNIANVIVNQPVLLDRKWAEGHILSSAKAETVSEDGEHKEKVLADVYMTYGNVGIISISGVIVNGFVPEEDCDYTDVSLVESALQILRGDPDIASIWLVVDSPGGFVSGIKGLADLINEVDKEKPTYCWIYGCAFSAAYWLASQCRYIYTDADGMAGSIGDYMITVDRTKELAQAGVELNIFSAGEGKLAGNSVYSLSEEDKKHFQSVIDKTYAQFIEHIDRKRKVDHANAKAYTWDAEESVRLGLVDGLYPSFVSAVQATL